MEFYLGILVVVIAILVYTLIELYNACGTIRQMRGALEEFKSNQIGGYGKDFEQWLKEINDE